MKTNKIYFKNRYGRSKNIALPFHLCTLLLLEFVDSFQTLWTWSFDVHGRKQKMKVSSRLIAMDLSFHGYPKIKNINLSINKK